MSVQMQCLEHPRPMRDPEAVIAAFVRLRGLNRTELLEGFGKTRAATAPRHELMWLLRDLTTLSLSSIGRSIGGRDLATVHAGIANVADRVAADAGYRDQLLQARTFILTFQPDDAEPRLDAASVLSRRILMDGSASAEDATALAITMLAVAAILRSAELTDAEARQSALTIIRNAKGVTRG